MKKKIVAILLVLCMVMLMVPVSAIGSISVASAEDNGTLVIHFYNGANEYSFPQWGEKKVDCVWVAYYWIDTGRVAAEKTDANGMVVLDDEFYRGDNKAHIFEIHLNASETRAVKQKKKLGLIMVRAYIDELGYLTPYWRNNLGKDLPSDRMISVELDENGRDDYYIIAGDKNNYTSAAEAMEAFQRVESAKFDDFSTLIVQTTSEVTTSTNVTLYKDMDLTDEEDGEIIFQGKVTTPYGNSMGGTINLGDLFYQKNKVAFDWNADYKVYVEGIKFSASVIKTRLYLSDEFQTQCIPTNQNTELGAIYKKNATVVDWLGNESTKNVTLFKYWAPVSTNVEINLYNTGDELDDSLFLSTVDMVKSWEVDEESDKTQAEILAESYPSLGIVAENGIWIAVVEEDLNGVYYTYTNYTMGEGVETVDIYAKAVGVNGNRGMVCDLSATDPDGWDEDLQKAIEIRNSNSDTAVIWEIHVRDFSVAPDNGMTYHGKYLAFTEEDTHVKGDDTLKTGIAYLKELGVTYVHLNPVYDFSTVDEEYIHNTDYNTKQNWGYDPKNYNVPEGSYATNAEDGAVRINEFKQMVQALHNAGIGVIMDVVYNHTYTVDSWFEKSVPGYYYRQALSGQAGSFGFQAWTTNPLGGYNYSDASGCSNETASERAMFRKYMIDSLTYWVEEYHIDGFRFDLMEIHDVQTMNRLRVTFDGLKDISGAKIIIYGEPWAADSLGIDTWKKYLGNDEQSLMGAGWHDGHIGQLDPRIMAFNDRFRDGIKGDGDGWGYIQGNTDTLDKVKEGIKGYFKGVDTGSAVHSIAYVASHDNYTTWDQLVHTVYSSTSPTLYSQYNSVLEHKNMMAATLTLTARGKSFMLAGDEIARTKYGNHNSYNAQDKVNAFDYYRQEEFSALFEWYKGLIALRTQLFPSIATGAGKLDVKDEDGCLVYTYESGLDSDKYVQVKILLNPFGYDKWIGIDGEWTILGDATGFDAVENEDGKVVDLNGKGKASTSFECKPYSSNILVQIKEK